MGGTVGALDGLSVGLNDGAFEGLAVGLVDGLPVGLSGSLLSPQFFSSTRLLGWNEGVDSVIVRRLPSIVLWPVSEQMRLESGCFLCMLAFTKEEMISRKITERMG